MILNENTTAIPKELYRGGMCVVWGFKLAFRFFSIVRPDSKQRRKPATRGMSSQHMTVSKNTCNHAVEHLNRIEVNIKAVCNLLIEEWFGSSAV